MILFYVRHGDPIYSPDSLTPLGKRQAEAAAKRLALYGVDRIFASTSNRAMQTAQPTCEILKKEMTTLEFCKEDNAWKVLAIDTKAGRKWMFQDTEGRQKLLEESVRRLDDKWYEHPYFEKYNFKDGIENLSAESDKFLLSLGYEHIKNSGKYKVVEDNNERVALFAHQGFGMFFLSHILDIPYPQFCTHFDICHTGITAIEFKNEDGYAIPRVMTLSSDSHLYREGLPTNYNNELRF